MVEQASLTARVSLFKHLKKCEDAGTWVNTANALPIPMPAPDDCGICMGLTQLLSDLEGAMQHTRKVADLAADLEELT